MSDRIFTGGDGKRYIRSDAGYVIPLASAVDGVAIPDVSSAIVAGNEDIDAHITALAAAAAQAVLNASMPAFYETIPSGAVAASVIAAGALSPGAGWYATRIDGPARAIAIATGFTVKNGATIAGNLGFGAYLRSGADFTKIGGTLIAAATNNAGAAALQTIAPTATIAHAASPEIYLVMGMSNASHQLDRMGGEVVKTGVTFESFFLAAGSLAVPAIGQPMPDTITGMAATSIIPWIVAK